MKQIIYLVDDDEDDCYLVQRALHPEANCDFSVFNDGHALINFLVSHPATPLPTLILLDLNMPLLNGFETLQMLKANPEWATIPVVILTTSDHPDDRTRGYALGADAFLTKPADYKSLNEVLASVSSCWRSVLEQSHNV